MQSLSGARVPFRHIHTDAANSSLAIHLACISLQSTANRSMHASLPTNGSILGNRYRSTSDANIVYL